MNNRTRLGLGVMLAALAMGVLGDGLLRATPWGANVGLWTAALAATVVGLGRWQRLPLVGAGRWLLLLAILFAAALAGRASPVLGLVNFLAALIALGLGATYSRQGRLYLAGLADYALGLMLAGLSAAFGPILLFLDDIRWGEVPREGIGGKTLAVGRGLIFALPLVFVFGALFMAADAVFEGMVNRVFRLDLTDLVTHLFLIPFGAWMVAGFLRYALWEGFPFLESNWARLASSGPAALSLGSIEIGVVLGTLNALFLAFVLVQLRYFFGGAALVEASTHLTYAEYARRGFFELVAVAALVLPLLLGVDWVRRRDRPGYPHLFRLLAGALVVMLFVIMVSAFQRMRLYQDTFGLTELRLYTTVFMGWLAVLFVWFLATVLRGRREGFAFGALVTGFLVVGLLNVLNPDDFIARTNLARLGAGHPFDSAYVTGLSADAVPVIVAALPGLPATERSLVAGSLLQRWSPPSGTDWRTWNWGRAQAWEAVRFSKEELQRAAGK